MNRNIKLFLSMCLLIGSFVWINAAELVIADKGTSDYQIVVPDKYPDAVIDNWINTTASLIQAAFKSNGFNIPVIQESKKDASKPCIYIGNTEFASKNGVDVSKFNDWTYVQKVVGKDIIIAGNDKTDITDKKNNPPMCLLGTVKGVTDFLRQYAGARFLWPSLKHSNFRKNTESTVKIDPIGIEFLKTPKISVPDDLNLIRKPVILVNTDFPRETFYQISLNLFPQFGGPMDAHSYPEAIPAEEYREKHPEYFALLNGKRACDIPSNAPAWQKKPWLEQYCISNPDVQELIYKRMLKRLDAGNDITSVGQPDGFQPCQCENCKKLYNTGDDWNEKLWLFHRELAERLQKERPGKKVSMLCYVNTSKPPKTFTKFPESAMLAILGDSSDEELAEWKKLEVPGGFISYLHTWGGYHQGSPYTPVRTPEYIEKLVKKLYSYNVKVIVRDGAIGYCWGLEAPVYYAYGRMFDDPEKNNVNDLVNEFCTAAFGKATPAMTSFYDKLYKQIAIYSDTLGTHCPAWKQTRYHGNMSLIGFIYSPDFLAAAENDLRQAEKLADSDRVKARLSLIRLEFDYIKGLASIIHFYQAYQLQPDKDSLERLLDSIDKWHGLINSCYDEKGRMKALKNWPDMYPFSAHPKGNVALEGDGYQNLWKNTCLNWDTQAMRNTAFKNVSEMKVSKVSGPVDLDSDIWNKVSGESLCSMKTGVPFKEGKTSLKMLYDNDNLYIRVDSEDFNESVSKIVSTGSDGDMAKQETIDLSIAPFAEKEKFYHFAVTPSANSKYDALCGFITDPIHPLYGKDDVAWNGEWEYLCRIDENKKIWTAIFKIPFKTLKTLQPSAGTVWTANIGRKKFYKGVPENLIWSFKPGVKNFTDSNAFGNLIFEK